MVLQLCQILTQVKPDLTLLEDPDFRKWRKDRPVSTARSAGIAMLLYDGPAASGGRRVTGCLPGQSRHPGVPFPCRYSPVMSYSGHG